MTTGAVRARPLWRERNFALLWAGHSINLTGNDISFIAIPLLAATVLGASPFEMSMLTAAGYLPYLLASLTAGAFVDRHRRRPLMIWCCLAQGLVMATIPITWATGGLTLGQVYVVSLVVSSMGVVFEAASLAYLPSIVDRDRLVDANGKIGTSRGLAVVVGNSAGGGLVALIGAAWTVGLDALSFLMSALAFSRINKPEPAPAPKAAESTYRKEIAEGLRYCLGNRLIRPLLLSDTFASAGIAASWSLWVLYVVQELHWPALVVGLNQAIAAIGGVLGGLILGRLTNRIRLSLVLLIATTAYIADMLPTLMVGPGLAGQIIVTVGYFVIFFGQVIYASTSQSLRHLICPPEMLGRVNATMRWLAYGLRPFVALAFGILATQLGLHAALSIAVGVFCLPFICILFSPHRTLRELPTQKPA